MVSIPKGKFLMGSNDIERFKEDKEEPVQSIEVPSFMIEKYSVTNDDFSHFVEDTGYKTDAEKYNWSFVFHLNLSQTLKNKSKKVKNVEWWYAVEKACWFKPEGPGSNIKHRGNHPVVHISWNDAIAYCQWSGKRLPSEVEWEYAARGGLVQKKYPWGDELNPGGEYVCNIWQGKFPYINTKEDGYLNTAPVDSFPPNNFGIYNLSGNVWEWCLNNFNDKFDNSKKVKYSAYTPSFKTIRGGSFLCHSSYCNRYRVSARTANTIDTSSANMGFRCALSVDK